MKEVFKNNFLIMLYIIAKPLKVLSPTVIIAFFRFDNNPLMYILSYSITLFVIFSYAFLKWNNISFIINKDVLHYNFGIIIKQRLCIFEQNISTIKLNQTVMQKFFNLYTLKIKTLTKEEKKEEITLLLKKDVAFLVKNKIESNMLVCQKESIESNEFKASSKDLLLYALTDNNITYVIGLIIANIGFLKKANKHLKLIKHVSFNLDIEGIFKTYGLYIIYIIIIAFLIFLLLCIIISIINHYIKFYNFKVYKEDDNIIIQYGILVKKFYVLPKNNTVAIKIRQNFIRQLLGLYKIDISNTGYGTKKEDALLFPICNKKKLVKIINTLLPEFKEDVVFEKPPKKALIKFILVPTNIFISICIVLTIINKFFIFSFIALPFFIADKYLNYKHTSIGFGKDLIVATSRGFFKNTTILKIKKIQMIKASSTYFQRRKHLRSYKIYFGTSHFVKGRVKLKHLRYNIFKELEKKIQM